MATTQYITITEFVEAFDLNVLQQLGSDTGTPLTGSPPVDASGILANAIERGSADVERAALRGQRYTEVELDQLVTDDDWTLKGLVASLSIKHLYRRRGGGIPDAISDTVSDAEKLLDELTEGKRVFNVADAISAGKPKVVALTSGTRDRMGLVSDEDFFPRRPTRTF